MRQRSGRRDEAAQIHVLEMITLFWVFFMTAIFLLQLKVPDPTSPASDGTLDLAAEDAYESLAGAPAVDAGTHTSLLAEMRPLAIPMPPVMRCSTPYQVQSEAIVGSRLTRGFQNPMG